MIKIMLEKTLLTVAGFDPTSGAGITLDLRVFNSQGFYGVGIITAVTEQNTALINKVNFLSPDIVQNQYSTLHNDLKFDGIKIGMLGKKQNINVIHDILQDHPSIPVVIDPVIESSSGTRLLEEATAVSDYIQAIKSRASLITPNLAEAEWLSGRTVATEKDMQTAAEKIYTEAQVPCLVTGGHLTSRSIDILFDGSDFFRFEKDKLDKEVHGTGCFLASTILCYLAAGDSLVRACRAASGLIHTAIKSAISPGCGRHIFFF